MTLSKREMLKFDNFPHFLITFLVALLPRYQCFHRTGSCVNAIWLGQVGKYDSPLWQIQMINECMQCVHQQFKPMGVGRNQLQCIGHPPAEIWFAQWKIQDDFVQEILVPKKSSSSSAPDQLSSWAAVARWRGGEGCSVPTTHQIGRSTVSNILGNSWSLPIHALRVVWNFSLQWCRRLSPPFWLRLDCRHCMLRIFLKGYWKSA